MVVTPPQAAAAVPDSKSSTDVTPPIDTSRWVCTSTPPGSTCRPVASISDSARARSAPIASIRPARIPRSARKVSAAVQTVPPRRTRSKVMAVTGWPRLGAAHDDSGAGALDDRVQLLLLWLGHAELVE